MREDRVGGEQIVGFLELRGDGAGVVAGAYDAYEAFAACMKSADHTAAL